MRSHVQRPVSGCFAAIRQLRQFRNSVPTATFQPLVVALLSCRLDYGNSVLVGRPIHLVRRLQSVQNAATRLICRLPRFDYVTDALVSLHWLRVPKSVVYKIAVHANVQDSSWNRIGVSRTCRSCRRSTWSTVSSLCCH